MQRLVVEPSAAHRCTLIALHGFSSNGSEFRDKLTPQLPHWIHAHARVVYLTAPLRRITCYNDTWYRSWHDYFTNHGDRGELIEETIDAADLDAVADRIRTFILQEARLAKPVWLIGESQGGCTALHVALRNRVPAIVMYAQMYKSSERHLANLPPPRVWCFHGGRDTVIPWSVASRRITGALGASVTIHARYGHAQSGPSIVDFLERSLVHMRTETLVRAAT